MVPNENYEIINLKVNGKAKRFTVSKSKYKHTKENDIVLIEKRENIFGMIFYNIY